MPFGIQIYAWLKFKLRYNDISSDLLKAFFTNRLNFIDDNRLLVPKANLRVTRNKALLPF